MIPDDPYLSPAAIARMRDDLERLLKRERPAAAEEVVRTGAMGDFSENAAYQSAKARLRGINDRILTLQERLKRAIPIAKTGKTDRVAIGSVVTVRVGPAERKYEIVGSLETDPGSGKVSRSSPLGAALLGAAVGDTVSVKTPAGETRYEIIAIA